MASRLLAAAGMCAAGVVLASPPAPIAARVARAQRVVVAEIGAQKTEVPDGNVRRMVTATTVIVREHLKGSGPSQLTVLQAGGKSGPWEAHATGDAVLAAGERAVLFLDCRNPAQPDRCTLSGLGEGKLPLDARGRALTEVKTAVRTAAKDGGK